MELLLGSILTILCKMVCAVTVVCVSLDCVSVEFVWVKVVSSCVQASLLLCPVLVMSSGLNVGVGSALSIRSISSMFMLEWTCEWVEEGVGLRGIGEV